MYSFLFRNRMGAIGFVVLTLVGAASLVGTEETEGVIAKTSAQIDQQRADFEEATATLSGSSNGPKPFTQEIPAEITFTADEDLIDSATGYDPTPEINFEEEAIAESEEVVIILNDGPEEAE